MSDFRRLAEDFWASPQISPDDVTEAAERGFAMVINNRPDGEVHDQPAGSTIEEAEAAAGLAYHAIPVAAGGFNEAQIEAMTLALDQAEGPVLAFCRSGTRSTLLWALTMASHGAAPDALTKAAAMAGYDLAPIRPAMEILAARSSDTSAD